MNAVVLRDFYLRFESMLNWFEHAETSQRFTKAAIGRITSHLMTMRRMSISIASMLEDGKDVAHEAALVKELGNNFEKVLPEIARLAAPLSLSSNFKKTSWIRFYCHLPLR